MKKIASICFAAMLAIVFSSCEKDPVKIIFEDGPLAGTTMIDGDIPLMGTTWENSNYSKFVFGPGTGVFYSYNPTSYGMNWDSIFFTYDYNMGNGFIYFDGRESRGYTVYDGYLEVHGFSNYGYFYKR